MNNLNGEAWSENLCHLQQQTRYETVKLVCLELGSGTQLTPMSLGPDAIACRLRTGLGSEKYASSPVVVEKPGKNDTGNSHPPFSQSSDLACNAKDRTCCNGDELRLALHGAAEGRHPNLVAKPRGQRGDLESVDRGAGIVGHFFRPCVSTISNGSIGDLCREQRESTQSSAFATNDARAIAAR